MLPIVVPPVQIPEVPYYSQLQDIKSFEWRKKGCGVASLAMVIDFYKTETISLNTLLNEAIARGAYSPSGGWKHHDLVLLAEKYGLDGESYDFSKQKTEAAFAQFKNFLNKGPVIASIFYKFDPKNPLSHLIVIDGIKDDIVYYSDPSGKKGISQIPVDTFLKAWKKRLIVIRPLETDRAA